MKLYVPIGPSGAGKSTKFASLKQSDPTIQLFSYDTLRLDWYGGEDRIYENAWKLATQDPQFNNRARSEFVSMLASKTNIYVDNTNLTPKSRSFFIQKARQNGYETIALVFNVGVDELVARQQTRTDKTVPDAAVRQQASVLKGPVDGEFDRIEYV